MRQLFFLLIITSLYPLLPAMAQDGPYIIYNDDGHVKQIVFDKELNMSSQTFSSPNSMDSLTVSTQEGGYSFSVKLHEIATPSVRYDMPARIVVLSDPHGDFVPFVTTLQGAGVIDQQLNWIFGHNHLMIIGDISDRGEDVAAIYWLTYKLEEQAREAGGVVHFLIGNHEVMVAQSDLRYTASKYDTIAKQIGLEHSQLWDSRTELGRWINSRNQIEVIGNLLFVHAGISRQIPATGLTIEQINDTVRKYMVLKRKATAHSPVAELVMRSNGTLWYRGMVNSNEDMNSEILSGILNYFGVKKIIVGHTMKANVSEFFDGRVINVNVNNQKNMDKGASQGIIITPADIWPIDAGGNRLDFKQLK